MATIVQQPASTDTGSGIGFLLGIVLLILFVLGLLYYGLPAIQNQTAAPTIQVPDRVDVNVNGGGNGGSENGQ